jgi:hypothetical protein
MRLLRVGEGQQNEMESTSPHPLLPKINTHATHDVKLQEGEEKGWVTQITPPLLPELNTLNDVVAVEFVLTSRLCA